MLGSIHWEAIELYFKGCENNKLSIATSAD